MVDFAFLLPLIYNAALLLALAVIYDVLDIPARGRVGLPQQMLLGISVGVIGLVIMVTPWQYAPGIVFDLRAVLLSVAGLFFGALPALIAMAMTAALRIYQGGSGAVMGVAVILSSGAIGIGWRYWRRQALPQLSWGELFLFGFVVQLTMLAMTVFLPSAVRQNVLAAIVLPVLLVYPVATALLGRLLVNRQRRELAVQALQQSEDRYRSYVDNAPYGVFVVDETGRFVEANPAACRIAGYSAAEILTMRIADTLTAESQAVGAQHFQQVVTEGVAFTEMTFRRKDGSTGWWSVAAVKLTPDRFLGFIIETTATRRAQAALAQAEAAYRDLYEHAPDMFISIDGATACVIQCNETLAQQLGWPKEAIIGRPAIDLYHPDSHAAFRALFQTFTTTGEVRNAEMRVLRRDGSDLWVILNAVAVRDDTGQIVRSRSIWRDITERKAAESVAQTALAALRQREERFRHVASTISDIAYSCLDEDGGGFTLEWMTGAAERITGYTVAEIADMRCWGKLVVAEDYPTFTAQIAELAIGQTSDCELRLRHRQGRLVWVMATAECVADGDGPGARRRLYGALVDITARKEAEAALRQSEERAVALLNATDDAAFLTDREGRVLAMNVEVARRLGRPEHEIRGAPIYELLAPAVAQQRRELVDAVLRTGSPVRYVDDRDGWVIQNSVYPVKDEVGAITGVAVFGRDITGQRQAEDRYQTLFREMLDGFALHEIVCDAQGQPVDYRFLAVNPAFERMTGLRAADAIGHTVLELMPSTEAYWIETYGSVALTGAPAFIENYSQAVGRYFEVTAFSPAPGQFATIFADVTDRKQGALALQRRDALLEALSYAADRFLQAENWEDELPGVLARLGEAAQVSRVYVFQNEDGAGGAVLTSQRFEWCAPGVIPQIDNPVLQRAAYDEIGFGRWQEILARGELIRSLVSDLPASERELLAAQDVLALVEVPIHVDQRWWGFAGFERCDQEHEWSAVEVESLRAAGHVFSAAVKNQENRVRLRAQAEQMAQIMQSVADGLLLIDDAGAVLMANPPACDYLVLLTGAADCRQIVQLGDAPLASLLAPPQQAGQGHILQAHQRTFDLLAHPVARGAQPGAWVLVLRDVTNELTVQQQLQRQERLAAIGQLAAGIAHDFNNLMSVIILYAQLTGQSPELGERERERLAIIEQQGQRGAAMIRQILDFSRRTVLDRQPMDLLPLLKEEVKLLTRTLPEHIVIHLDCTPGEYIVRGDPTRLDQVIMNLAVNARDAMPEGGRLTFSLDRVVYASAHEAPVVGMKVGAWLCLRVADTGLGIAPADLDHIFEPFFTTKAVGLGTGLGLAQVHGIVAQHDGYIAVESQAGAGATFTVYLPEADIVRAGAAPTAPMVALAAGHGETILLAEDEPYLRKTMTELLELWNYRVVGVANGAEALAVLDRAEAAIDLIISDVVMPEMSGIALFKALRKRHATTPLILLTGHPMSDELDSLRNFGLRAWLPKPPSADQLAAAIAAALTAGNAS